MPCHAPSAEQFERDHRVQGGLQDDGLVAVLAHRLLVVDHVVEVGAPRIAVLARAGHVGAGAGLPRHAIAQGRGVGQRRRDDVTRSDVDPAHVHGLGRIEPELVEGLQNVDELLAQPVLERGALAVDPARHQHDLFVLDVHALE